MNKSITNFDKNYEVYRYIYDSVNSYSSEQIQEMKELIVTYKNRANVSALPNNPDHALIKKIQKNGDRSGQIFLELFHLLEEQKQEFSDKKIINLPKFTAFLNESEKAQKDVNIPTILAQDSKYQAMMNEMTTEMRLQQAYT